MCEGLLITGGKSHIGKSLPAVESDHVAARSPIQAEPLVRDITSIHFSIAISLRAEPDAYLLCDVYSLRTCDFATY